MKKVIGFAGPMGSGKDTYGKAVKKIAKKRGIETVHLSFATPLREELNCFINSIRLGLTDGEIEELMTIPVEQVAHLRKLHEQAEKESKEYNAYTRIVPVRTMLQYFGTDIRRKQDENYWVKQATEIIQQYKDNVIIYLTDVRYPNEAEAIKELGGIVVRLTVPETAQRQRLIERDGKEPTRANLDNISETAHLDYKEYDFVIATEEIGLENLENETKKLIDFLLRG